MPLYPDQVSTDSQERTLQQDFGAWVENVQSPTLFAYPLMDGSARGAVLICPGGAYIGVAMEHEGHAIARWLNTLNVAAFVLKYRLPPAHRHPTPLNDAKRAMRIIRARALEWNVDPNRIAVMGFSAGGHLASTLGTQFDIGNRNSADAIERQSSRPDGMILIYPVIALNDDVTHVGSRDNLLGSDSMKSDWDAMSSHRRATAHCPPTILIHAEDDTAVPPKNSVLMHEALMRNGVRSEIHLISSGGHGFGIKPNVAPPGQWLSLLERWLRGMEY